jgi:uncharacterized protein (TIGR02186 family)
MFRKTGFLVIFLGLWFLFMNQAWASVTCEIEPNYIPIHFFYNGAQIKIFGHSDQPADFVVVIQDEAEKVELRRKGKVKGLFWMNVGEISFEPVPTAFMVFSSRPLDQILDESQQTRYGIGYAALFKEVKVEPDPGPERAKWIKEFIRFKEKLHLYRERFNAIEVKPEGQSASYHLELHWPFQAPPGVYTVTVYAIKDGKVVDSCKKTIKIEKVGLLKTISDLAFKKAALYGIIAIVIAVFAGIGVGLIFGSKGGH